MTDHTDRRRKAAWYATGILAAALAVGSLAASTAVATSPGDCARAEADELSRMVAVTESTLVHSGAAISAGDYEAGKELALRWRDQRADMRAAQRAYSEARAACAAR